MGKKIFFSCAMVIMCIGLCIGCFFIGSNLSKEDGNIIKATKDLKALCEDIQVYEVQEENYKVLKIWIPMSAKEISNSEYTEKIFSTVYDMKKYGYNQIQYDIYNELYGVFTSGIMDASRKTDMHTWELK